MSAPTPAQQAANQIGQQLYGPIKNQVNIMQQVLASGVSEKPAFGTNPDVPAVLAADIVTAAGAVLPAQVALIVAAIATTDPTKLAAALAAL